MRRDKIFTFMLLFYNYINNFTNALCCCWVFSWLIWLVGFSWFDRVLSLRKLILVFLYVGTASNKFLAFCVSGISLHFSFIFHRKFCWIENSEFEYGIYEYVIPTTCGLHGFWWEINCNLIENNLYVMI